MFVGHYAVALAAKRAAPGTSLGWSFFAVQFLDVLWAPAILLGIEHARVVPGFLPASSLDLYDMPWTHSLAMALAWAWLYYRVSKVPMLGICVFSHWILDLVAHRPDLPITRGGPYVGLGLWRFREASFITESALLVIGLIIYLRATRAKNTAGRYAMSAFVALMVVVEAVNIYGPPPPNITTVAITAEASYLSLAAVAGWLDRMREPVPRQAAPIPSITGA